MAFTRPSGKHRAPGRMSRTTARLATTGALAATGVIGTLAGPALASGPAPETTLDLLPAGVSQAEPDAEPALAQAIGTTDALADRIGDQAAAQQLAAEQARVEAARKAEAERLVAERRAAEAKAKKEREAKERAARAAAERKRLNTYVAPVAGSYVSTGYHSGGSLWSSGSHSGVDFHAASGTEVVSVGHGTVVETGWGGAYGNNVVIKMHDGTYTQYGHLTSATVSVGQTVTPGQQIGISGSTGNSTGPHLHFEARTSEEYGSDIDPVAYLRGHGVKV
ncbi:M23 family metallopeptidase [Streptomyces sp. NPDC060194]|uniref:M23 family metallopeptidase n=1 Tax=Streptomyces sp. NPDC060194 TaxID=3347069 RepID=UPI003655839E